MSYILGWSIMCVCLLFVANSVYLGAVMNIVVVSPTFTYSAYQPNGFYSHYAGNCSDCLTVPLYDNLFSNLTQKYAGSVNAVVIATMLGYHVVSDQQIITDNYNPYNYHFILLHEEYVTQYEFNIFNSSKSLVLLYPNALYGNVTYHDGKITLVSDITHRTNAFHWQVDNTSAEQHNPCKGGEEFEQIDYTIHRLNCWTQDPIQIFEDLVYLEFKGY